MDRDCYKGLSKYFALSSPGQVYSRLVGGKMYDLVYAEDRWFRTGMENDTLKQRTEYHIAQTLDTANFDSLKSTLRSSLACLIADEIAARSVNAEVDSILKNGFIVYKIGYTEIAAAAKRTFFDQVGLIIEKLNPLFNVRNSTDLERLPEIYSTVNNRRIEVALNTLNGLSREANGAMVATENATSSLLHSKMKQAIYYWQGIYEMDI